VRSESVAGCTEIDHIASSCLDGSTNYQATRLERVGVLVMSFYRFQRDKVVKVELLVLGVLDDELSGDWAFVAQS